VTHKSAEKLLRVPNWECTDIRCICHHSNVTPRPVRRGPLLWTEAYNWNMARGWQSKSVESQLEDATVNASSQTERNSPSAEQVHQQIRKANLLLSRKRILQQLEASNSERYSELLRRSLNELDTQLSS